MTVKSNFRKKVENAIIRAGYPDTTMSRYVYCDRNKLSSKVKYCFIEVDTADQIKIQAAVELEFPGHGVELVQTEYNTDHMYHGYHWGLTIRVFHDANVKLGDDESVVDMTASLKAGWLVDEAKRTSATIIENNRSELIGQLRTALCQAESPHNDIIEFDIGDTDFCFDFSQ